MIEGNHDKKGECQRALSRRKVWRPFFFERL